MYNLRRTTKNPAHLQQEMGERRSRENILGTPDREEDNSKAIVPEVPGQPQPNISQAQVQRGGDDEPIVGPAWTSLTDTMKIVIVLQTMEHSANAADYLDLDEKEMANANPLLAIEKARENQYEEDADALTQVIGRFVKGLITNADLEDEMEEVLVMTKKHLMESLPAGFLVQLRDVEIAQEFVRGRAPDFPVCEQIIKGLSMHVGKDYSMETIGALVSKKDGDKDREADDDEIEEQSTPAGTKNLD